MHLNNRRCIVPDALLRNVAGGIPLRGRQTWHIVTCWVPAFSTTNRHRTSQVPPPNTWDTSSAEGVMSNVLFSGFPTSSVKITCQHTFILMISLSFPSSFSKRNRLYAMKANLLRHSWLNKLAKATLLLISLLKIGWNCATKQIDGHKGVERRINRPRYLWWLPRCEWKYQQYLVRVDSWRDQLFLRSCKLEKSCANVNTFSRRL